LLVVIAIIAVLMGILMPALARVREQGKRANCMGNLRQMQMAWIMYADEQGDRIPLANPNSNGWVEWVREPATEEEKLEGLRNGKLYPYCSNEKIYKCPTGVRGEVVTYAICDAMNGYDQHPWTREDKTMTIKKRSSIRRPSDRMVFLDEGRLSSNSWTIWYTKPAWWDQITNRHGMGTNFSFADGHVEYYKFNDQRTFEVANADFDKWQGSLRLGSMATQPGNKDLHRVQRIAWGKLGYAPEPTK
jgi:prepilin-type processing-associated H-X9-DG protein